MPDLAQQLRHYFDALVPDEPVAVAPQRPRRRTFLALPLTAAALIGAMLVLSRPEHRPADTVRITPATTVPSPPPTATTEHAGLRLTIRLLDAPPAGPFTVEARIENIGSAAVGLHGQLEPDECRPFPVHVDAVRVAWEPGDQPWPGADRVLGIPVTGPGWSNLESRGSPFVDPPIEESRRRPGEHVCDLAGRTDPIRPGQHAQRVLTWSPPTGWPGGRHRLVAQLFYVGPSERGLLGPAPITASIPVNVHAPTSDQMGPAEALHRLAANPAFAAEVGRRDGLLAITSQWGAQAWSFTVQYGDRSVASWTVDQGGAVARTR